MGCQAVVAREAAVDMETHRRFAAVRETRAHVPNIHGGKNIQITSVGALHKARDPSAHRLRRPAEAVRLVTWQR